MPRRPHALLPVVLVVLLAVPLAAQRVGASLNLEGRAALLRAADFLLQRQRTNGSWHESIALTALATHALHAAAPALPADLHADQAITQARNWLQLHAKTTDLRPLLIPATPATSPHETLLRLDAQSALPAPDTSRWPPVPRLAAHLLAAPQPDDASLRLLYTAARHLDWNEAALNDAYWAARAFTACNRANAIPYDHWQTDILSALLDRQLGDGSWHAPEASPTDALHDTALTLLTLVLCLRE
ncbi:MAG: hypothetical protein ACI4WT_13250 [Oligosphaeraceae bacterium]